MIHSASIHRSSSRKRYGRHASSSAYADEGLRLGRTVPQRSLPPCGGGTGRGVERAQRLFELCANLRARQTSRSVFVATPLPVPPPLKGRSRPSATGYGGRKRSEERRVGKEWRCRGGVEE